MNIEYDAIEEGIEPGGLRTTSSIRLLICYILDTMGKPVRQEYVVTAMTQNSIANYFDIIDAFVDLRNKKNIILVDKSQDTYTVSKTGKLIASSLGDDLPLTIRERAFASVCDLFMREQNKNENSVEIIKQTRGYMVDCHINGGDHDLLRFQLYVPDSKQARLVKKNFQNNPEIIYKTMIATITRNSDFAKNALEDIINLGFKKN